MREYEKCCCYNCDMNTESETPDCACEDAPYYSQERCMDCPKRYFCDVTKQPQKYMEAETPFALQMPPTCSECPVFSGSMCYNRHSDFCHAALWRHFCRT